MAFLHSESVALSSTGIGSTGVAGHGRERPHRYIPNHDVYADKGEFQCSVIRLLTLPLLTHADRFFCLILWMCLKRLKWHETDFAADSWNHCTFISILIFIATDDHQLHWRWYYTQTKFRFKLGAATWDKSVWMKFGINFFQVAEVRLRSYDKKWRIGEATWFKLGPGWFK